MPWEQRTSLPITNYGSCAAVVSGKIYSIGGYSATTATYEYDPVLNTWTAKASASVTVRDHQAAVLSGLIYIVQDGDSNEFRTFNPSTNTWATITDSGATTTGAQYCWVVSDGSNIYQGGGVASTSVNRWNGSAWTNALTTVSPANFSTGAKAVFGPDGKIYVTHGVIAGATSGQMLQYTPPTTWATKATSATARHVHAAVTANPWIYILGGQDSSNAATTSVLRYDPLLDTYTAMENLPYTSTLRLSAAFVAPYLYVWSGSTTGNVGTAVMYRMEAGYDELVAAISANSTFHPFPSLIDGLEAESTLVAGLDVSYMQGVEADSFIAASSTGSQTFDSLFPSSELFPSDDLYPSGD